MIVIDYRQLLDKIDNPPYTLYSAGDRAAWLDECIATAHAFEAEPVKHGRWILCDDGYVRCSECNCKAFIENDETIITDFCHGCGTDMRMDGDSE